MWLLSSATKVNVDAVEVCNAGCNNIYYGRVPGGGQSGRTFVCGDDSGTNTDQVLRVETRLLPGRNKLQNGPPWRHFHTVR